MHGLETSDPPVRPDSRRPPAGRVRVLVLSRYGPLGASSRVRMYQFVEKLAGLGVDAVVQPLLPDGYVRARYANEAFGLWPLIACYLRRAAVLLEKIEADVVWLEKEALPWVPFFIERVLLPSRRPLVVEYDDAVFHQYERHPSAVMRRLFGRKIDRVMAAAAVVIAGNRYLADRATVAGARRVMVVPSTVDTGRFRPAPPLAREGCVVGWIGSPATAKYLDGLRAPLERLRDRPGFEVHLVGAPPGTLADVGARVWSWDDATEVERIHAFDVGVMPLADGEWERGKCGYKLIQYMACGRPVVASPVGVNVEIVDADSGILASTSSDWEAALEALAGDPERRTRMGASARQVVEARYSADSVAATLAGLFQDLGARREAAR